MSTFDRFTVGPMLVTIAADLRISLEEIAAAASLYYALRGNAAGLGHALYRLGRVGVMRWR